MQHSAVTVKLDYGDIKLDNDCRTGHAATH
jgi:hypothetical protein